MGPSGIMLVLVCLACLVFVVFRVRALWQCWTSLFVVCGDRCFRVCGYTADDLLGLSSPQILDRRGKVFLANGNEVRRLRNSELKAWLFEDELRATERNFRSYRKICVVRTPKVIGPSHTAPTNAVTAFFRDFSSLPLESRALPHLFGKSLHLTLPSIDLA